jgi:cyclomaltodextrinase
MPIYSETPEWVKDAIFYQIFPDRFAKSEKVQKPNNLEPWDTPPTTYGFKGGDLYGVFEQLDYLQDLGINAIYFNPIFQSASNHRYHTHDYYKVDPILGGNDIFMTLLSEAHRRGIRIILDGVFNHASRGFFQFNHILETGSSSPYQDWFTIKDFPLNAYDGKPNYKCWWGLPALPEFNTDNPMVRQFIFDIARYWIDRGIDGWRLDVPFSINDDTFWQEFRQTVKNANPDAYLVAEIPWEAQHWLQGDQFDAVMNYQFTQACLGFFANKYIDRDVENGMMGLPKTSILDAVSFAARVQELINLYPKQSSYAQLNLLDSHDMPRFISLAGGDKQSLQLSILFQMIYPGAPCIYYGDEIGMSGGESGRPEPSRASFPWKQSLWDHDLRNFYKRCIQLRKSQTTLRHGEFTVLHAESQICVFLHRMDADILISIFNNQESDYTLDIPLEDSEFLQGKWKDLLSERTATSSNNRFSDSTIPARSGCVFIRQS